MNNETNACPIKGAESSSMPGASLSGITSFGRCPKADALRFMPPDIRPHSRIPILRIHIDNLVAVDTEDRTGVLMAR